LLKDLIEHVRAVHFTALLISFVMLVAGLAPNHWQIARAYAQVLAIKDRIHETTDGFEGFAKLEEAETASISTADRQELILEAFDPDDAKKRPERCTIKRLVLSNGSSELKEFGRYKFGTLGDFRGLWENPPIVYGFHSSASVAKPLRASECTVVKYRKKEPGWIQGGGLSSCKPPGSGEQSLNCEVGITDGPLLRCAWPIPGLTLIQGNASAFRSQMLPWVSTPSGKFATDFPELAEQTHDEMGSSLDSVVTSLAARSEGPSDRIEILGAKIPLENIAITGALLLVSVQLYLLMHLVELGRRLKEESGPIPPVGFIGLYPERWTRMIFLASLALPVVSESYTLFRTWGNRSQLVIDIPIIISSSLLMLWCIKVALPMSVSRVIQSPATLSLQE
jgi:hypothetical protein